MFSLSIFNSACLSPAPAEKTVVVPRPEFIDLTDRIHMRQFALKDEGPNYEVVVAVHCVAASRPAE